MIAMQFTDEVNWGVFDFLVMGTLLLIVGFVEDFLYRKIKNVKHRRYALLTLAIVFLLTWAELAVGIFGSPFAGS